MAGNVLRKALDVVQLVALRGEMTVREIGVAMGMPKSTAHRLVANLVEARLLRSHPGEDGDLFSLGTLIDDLAGGLSWRTLVQCARPQMIAVRDDIGETVGLHVLFGERRLLVEQVVSDHQHRWVYNNQMVPMPLYAGAAAKMLLAMLPEPDMRRLAERDHPLAGKRGLRSRDLESFLRDLGEIRRRNHSSSSEEVNPGIASVAVPVIADTGGGHPLAVMSLAGPSIRFTDKAVKRSLQRLRQAADAIAEELRASAGAVVVRDRTFVNARRKEANGTRADGAA